MLPGYVIVVMVIRICCYGYQVEDFLSGLNAFWELARSFVAGFTSYFLLFLGHTSSLFDLTYNLQVSMLVFANASLDYSCFRSHLFTDNNFQDDSCQHETKISSLL